MASFAAGQAKLKIIQRQLKALGSEKFRSRLVAQLAEAAKAEVLLGFETSTDPYGKKWAPVIRGGMPLLDTGRLRNSITVTHTSKSFRIGTNVKYAQTHQHGATIKAKEPGKPLRFKVGAGKQWRSKYAVKIPQRMFLPARQLPPRWRPIFIGVTDRVIKELLHGG